MYDGPTNKNCTDVPKRRRTRTSRSEVEWAINQLPLGKSAGNDAIHGEMIKASGEEGISIYHKFCTKYGTKRNGLQNGRRQFLSPYL